MEKSNIILDEKTDFTLTGLVMYLNNTFGLKKSGKLFNYADVEQYIFLGKLPKYLGGATISPIPNEMKLKIYRIENKKLNKEEL